MIWKFWESTFVTSLNLVQMVCAQSGWPFPCVPIASWMYLSEPLTVCCCFSSCLWLLTWAESHLRCLESSAPSTVPGTHQTLDIYAC